MQVILIRRSMNDDRPYIVNVNFNHFPKIVNCTDDYFHLIVRVYDLNR